MLLLLLACQADPHGSGNGGDVDADVDADADTDSDSDSDTDVDTMPFPAGTTGFTATSIVTGEYDGRDAPEWWCSMSVAITGTRQDDVCRGCDYAFTLEAVPTYAPDSDPACAAPVLATMMADSGRTDVFLGYHAYEWYGGVNPIWYVGYTTEYTVMDVEGQVSTSAIDFTRRYLGEPGDVTTTAEGFAWAAHLGFDGWRPEYAPMLWTACSDWSEGVAATGSTWSGAYVEEDVTEIETEYKEGDRWLLPLVAGDTVDLAWRTYAGESGFGAEPLNLYVVRPDGCVGQRTLTTGSGTSFVANVTGDWHLVMEPYNEFVNVVQVYRLFTQVNGQDVTPALVDDDAHMFYLHDGQATIEGTWTP